MKKFVVSIADCQKCAMLKAMAPDAENLVLDPMDFMPFCRAAGIKTVPFVVITGEPHELAKILENKDVYE